MELRHLRCFVVVAEELHFGHAAQRLEMAQPHLSRVIKQLEAEVQARLLNRTHRTVELTEAGKTLLVRARQILASVDAVPAAMRRAERGQAGEIAVGFNSAALSGMLPQLVRAFRQRFPGVEIELWEMSSSEQARALAEHRIDLALLCPPIAHRGLEWEIVLREPLIVAMPQGHPLVRKRRLCLADLKAEDFVSCWSDSGYCAQHRALCRRLGGFEPRIVQTVHDGHTAMAMVEAGIGISLLGTSARRYRPPKVIIHDLTDLSAVLEVAMAWRRDDSSSALHQFKDEVRRTSRRISGSLIPRLSEFKMSIAGIA